MLGMSLKYPSNNKIFEPLSRTRVHMIFTCLRVPFHMGRTVRSDRPFCPVSHEGDRPSVG